MITNSTSTQRLIDQLVKNAHRYGEADSLENVLLMKLFGTTRHDAEALGKPISYNQHIIITQITLDFGDQLEQIVTDYLNGDIEQIPDVYAIADLILFKAEYKEGYDMVLLDLGYVMHSYGEYDENGKYIVTYKMFYIKPCNRWKYRPRPARIIKRFGNRYTGTEYWVKDYEVYEAPKMASFIRKRCTK